MMNKHAFRFALLGALCAFGTLPAPAADGTVNATKLNIRIRPDLKSSAVLKLEKGARLNVLAESGEFVEIAAPQETPVYVSAVYIADGKTTRELKMYSAGSTAADDYGTLPSGSAVKILEQDRYGWAKIAPPDGIRLYAAKRFVTVAPVKAETSESKPKAQAEIRPEAPVQPVQEVKPEIKPETKPEVKPEVKPEAKPEVKPEVKPAGIPAQTQAALKELGIDLDKSRSVSTVGRFVKLESTTVPLIRYALLRNYETEYFVCSDNRDFKVFGEREVTVKGRSFKVPNWKYPVLYVDSVVESKPVK